MVVMIYSNLNPEKALIWRIVHRHNLPWILNNGLQAANNVQPITDWKVIGYQPLIARRGSRQVPLAPGGVLNDYVPFYFTPFSPMMYNIHTGRGGVSYVPNKDLVILVSSLHKVAELNLPFVFTDRHAYLPMANYYSDLQDLQHVDWLLLQQRNFKRNPDDPAAIERYQAEALVHERVPIEALLGGICYSEQEQRELQKQADDLGVKLQFHCRPNWYF